MSPVQFRHQTGILQPPPGEERSISPLPIFKRGAIHVSCWKMTWKERFSALLFGKTWLTVVTEEHPPVAIHCQLELLKVDVYPQERIGEK